MTARLDATHGADLTSWVASANGHPDFPIQNLPLGIVSAGNGERRPGVAIGDSILDLAGLAAAGLLPGEAGRFVEAGASGTLNAALALGGGPRLALRARLSELLREGTGERPAVEPHLHDAESCVLHLPAAIGDYTDFYAGIHHATNVGKQFRPDNPLLPNYKWVPIGYHGRASSVIPSGVPVRRPSGQRKPAAEAVPAFGPSRNLDYELELAIWIGTGNAQGEPVPIGSAAEHIAGYGLLNDWSARDIQAWEYQPLGPFLAKSFASTVSPWIVTPEALAPFRLPQPARPDGDPQPLPYLRDEADQREGALAIELEVLLQTPLLREKGLSPHRLGLSDARHMYWTMAQFVAHHTSGGCNLRPGDLLGTGTISAPDLAGAGSLLEASQGGREPIRLPSGEERRFLEDGDEVILRARCRREGFAPIGFGECRATILPAAVP
ncbi:fumarylacetoacetase [uncultured Enterovirga sp.]|uniref:fumarylacetoacetase n=1 Tax=uncultured Enterovirga sp. TaxID=2026352 RepID=UPI0035C948EB